MKVQTFSGLLQVSPPSGMNENVQTGERRKTSSISRITYCKEMRCFIQGQQYTLRHGTLFSEMKKEWVLESTPEPKLSENRAASGQRFHQKFFAALLPREKIIVFLCTSSC
jgi:hypothetical protein